MRREAGARRGGESVNEEGGRGRRNRSDLLDWIPQVTRFTKRSTTGREAWSKRTKREEK